MNRHTSELTDPDMGLIPAHILHPDIQVPDNRIGEYPAGEMWLCQEYTVIINVRNNPVNPYQSYP